MSKQTLQDIAIFTLLSLTACLLVTVDLGARTCQTEALNGILNSRRRETSNVVMIQQMTFMECIHWLHGKCQTPRRTELLLD
jgi:hypothetical protein